MVNVGHPVMAALRDQTYARDSRDLLGLSRVLSPHPGNSGARCHSMPAVRSSRCNSSWAANSKRCRFVDVRPAGCQPPVALSVSQTA